MQPKPKPAKKRRRRLHAKLISASPLVGKCNLLYVWDLASSQGRSPDEMGTQRRTRRGYPPHTQTFGVFLINTFLARLPVVEEDPRQKGWGETEIR